MKGQRNEERLDCSQRLICTMNGVLFKPLCSAPLFATEPYEDVLQGKIPTFSLTGTALLSQIK